MQLDELGPRLQERLRDRHDGVVIIKADKEVLHGRVVEVMDIAKAAGRCAWLSPRNRRPPSSRRSAVIRERTYTNLLIGLVLSVLIHGYIVMWGHRFPCQHPLDASRPRSRCNCANGPRPCLPLRQWKR